MNRAYDILRSGAWLTPERIRLVAVAILCVAAASIAFMLVTAHGLVDMQGRPLGTDFSSFYSAGTYVLEGNAQAPYDLARQHAREQAIFGAATPFYSWFYPPFFLFITAVLALLPYGAALVAWQVVTLVLYLLAIRAIISPSPRLRGEGRDEGASPRGSESWTALLLAVAFPAVLVNLGHGQNGFLTAALLGGALAILDRRPIVAGLLFGLLAYKPQFGLMIPLALAAGGYWRSFAAAVATIAFLAVAATIAFGPDVWRAFFELHALHAHRRARAGRSRLAQDAKPVCVGAHVGRTDSAGLRFASDACDVPRCRSDLAMAKQHSLCGQGRVSLYRDNSRDALYLRLRHDGTRARYRLLRRGWNGPRIPALGENSTGRALACAARRPQ